MVAGVMSGLAAYTGTDATWWRLGMVVFTLFYGVGILAYVILAIVLPQANLPEEKLKMQGIEVTPQNLAGVVVDHDEPAPHKQGWMREAFSVIMKLVVIFFFAIAVVVAVSLAIALLSVLMGVGFALLMPASNIVTLPFALGDISFGEMWQAHSMMFIGFVLSLLTVLFIPIYAIIHMMLSHAKKIKPMGITQRVVCIVLWLLATGIAINLGFILTR